MEELIKSLSDYGVSWVIVGIEAFAIWKLFRLYATTQDARIQEAKENTKRDIELTNTLKGLSETIKAFIEGKRPKG